MGALSDAGMAFEKKKPNGMKDAISNQRVETLHPKVKEDFRNFIVDAEAGLNIIIRITDALRTFEQQGALYAIGRTRPGKIVTKAQPGHSFHQYGLATDQAILIHDGRDIDWEFDMSKLVPFAEKYGITWGGNFPGGFKDYPHWEKSMGYSIQQLLAKYNLKQFIPGTQYVIL